MKISHTLSVCMLSTLFLLSCKESKLSELPVAPSDATEKNLEVNSLATIAVKDGCLVFESIEHMEETIASLLKVSNAERDVWCNEIGFTSLQHLYDLANEEINAMMSYAQYEGIQSKYKKSFLFNKNDKQDLPPYFRIKNVLYAYVLNASGKVICNNEVVSYNEVESVEETNRYAMSISASTKAAFENHLYINDGKRKLWVDTHLLGNNTVYIRFGCQVLSFWGWNVFSQQYHVYYNGDASGAVNVVLRPREWAYTNAIADGSYLYLGGGQYGRFSLRIYAGDMGPEHTHTFVVTYVY